MPRPSPSPEAGDTYGLALLPYLAGVKVLQSGPPVHLPDDWWVAGGRGATTNHDEQALALWAAQNLESVETLILSWYGEGIELYGDQRKEALWSKSHAAHYLSARGPLLLIGMQAGNSAVTEAMTKVWRRGFASFLALRGPGKIGVVCPGARHTADSDQRAQVNQTFGALERMAAGSPVGRLPKPLRTAPDWLGMHSLVLIAEAHRRGEIWAGRWPELLAEIAGGRFPVDLPPVAGGLFVERGKDGHVAAFRSVKGMLQPTPWATADYRSGGGEYGRPGEPVPPCPGGPGEVFTFPTPKGSLPRRP